jgi:hypothetical protein
MFSKVYFSCHFMWSFLICLYSDVLVLTVVHFVITWESAFLRCLSVCYIICDYHWFWFSPIAVLGWYVNVSNSWYQTFHGVRLLMLTSLLPHFCVSCHLVDWYSLCPFHPMTVVSVVDCTICICSSFYWLVSVAKIWVNWFWLMKFSSISLLMCLLTVLL